MSNILNQVKQVIEQSIAVEVQQQKYGKYPVIVTDTSESRTKGWTLKYNVAKSKYDTSLYSGQNRFEEVTIQNFSKLFADIQACYTAFGQGQGIEKRYGTNYAEYKPDNNLFFTCISAEKGLRITVTVVDDASPFHMLQMRFFVAHQGMSGGPYLVGYDKCFDASNDTFTDRMNTFMLPKKERFVPVTQDGAEAPSLIKAAGSNHGNGKVAIDTDPSKTEIEYIQEMKDERRMLAGIYETILMDVAFARVQDSLPESTSSSFGNASGNAGGGFGGSWNQGTPMDTASGFNQQQNSGNNQGFNQQQNQNTQSNNGFGNAGGGFGNTNNQNQGTPALDPVTNVQF